MFIIGMVSIIIPPVFIVLWFVNFAQMLRLVKKTNAAFEAAEAKITELNVAYSSRGFFFSKESIPGAKTQSLKIVYNPRIPGASAPGASIPGSFVPGTTPMAGATPAAYPIASDVAYPTEAHDIHEDPTVPLLASSS